MCSLCAWKARQPSQSHADARGAREGRCKDGKPSLRFVCLTFGRGEERRGGSDRGREEPSSARTPMRNLKRKLGRRSGIRFSAPGPPCRQAAAAAASIQFHHRLPADAILIPACCSPSSPHIAIVLGNATAFCNCLHSLSTPLLSPPFNQILASVFTQYALSLSLSPITHSTAGPGLLRLGGVSSSPLLCGQA